MQYAGFARLSPCLFSSPRVPWYFLVDIKILAHQIDNFYYMTDIIRELCGNRERETAALCGINWHITARSLTIVRLLAVQGPGV